jgi:hypothetical protein
MKPLPAGGAKTAVLRIVSQRSKGGRGVIAAATLREIQNDLTKIYGVGLSGRQILNHIHAWGDLIIRESDPMNRRRTLYRINPERVDEHIFTTVKMDDVKAFAHGDGYEGILVDPTPEETFLAIDRITHPAKARTNSGFEVEVRVNYALTKPSSIFLAVQPERGERWLTSKTRVLKGDGVETLTLKMRALGNPGEWRLRVKAYALKGLSWVEVDAIPIHIRLDEKYPREINVSGRKLVDRGDYLDETYYKLTIEVDSKEEVEEAEVYGRAIIESWLAEPPHPQVNQSSP